MTWFPWLLFGLGILTFFVLIANVVDAIKRTPLSNPKKEDSMFRLPEVQTSEIPEMIIDEANLPSEIKLEVSPIVDLPTIEKIELGNWTIEKKVETKEALKAGDFVEFNAECSYKGKSGKIIKPDGRFFVVAVEGKQAWFSADILKKVEFKVGDWVELTYGDRHRGQIGQITEITERGFGDKFVIKTTEGKDVQFAYITSFKKIDLPKAEFKAADLVEATVNDAHCGCVNLQRYDRRDVQKVEKKVEEFKKHDHVEILAGKAKGQFGMIDSIDDSIYSVVVDSNFHYISDPSLLRKLEELKLGDWVEVVEKSMRHYGQKGKVTADLYNGIKAHMEDGTYAVYSRHFLKKVDPPKKPPVVPMKEGRPDKDWVYSIINSCEIFHPPFEAHVRVTRGISTSAALSVRKIKVWLSKEDKRAGPSRGVPKQLPVQCHFWGECDLFIVENPGNKFYVEIVPTEKSNVEETPYTYAWNDISDYGLGKKYSSLVRYEGLPIAEFKDGKLTKRFAEEARKLAKEEHSHVLDAGVVMKWIGYKTIQVWVRQKDAWMSPSASKPYWGKCELRFDKDDRYNFIAIENVTKTTEMPNESSSNFCYLKEE